MVSLTSSGTFLFMWIGFMGLMITGITLILVWAARSRQFSNQDRARYLPLRSGIPDDKGKG